MWLTGKNTKGGYRTGKQGFGRGTEHLKFVVCRNSKTEVQNRKINENRVTEHLEGGGVGPISLRLITFKLSLISL